MSALSLALAWGFGLGALMWHSSGYEVIAVVWLVISIFDLFAGLSER
jgi:hypothetical protein